MRCADEICESFDSDAIAVLLELLLLEPLLLVSLGSRWA
jgi:hypothetical protein